jgi:hypothetical protein
MMDWFGQEARYGDPIHAAEKSHHQWTVKPEQGLKNLH